MSQPESRVELEIHFDFILEDKKFSGIFGMSDKGKVFFVEVHRPTPMNPLDVEKCLYQVAHIIAEKTKTDNYLTEEKLRVWN